MENPFQILEKKLDERFDELKTLIRLSKEEVQPSDTSKFLHSMQELADFLNISIVTAQKLKNKKIIPCIQFGRKVRFEKAAVLAALENHQPQRRSKVPAKRSAEDTSNTCIHPKNLDL